MGLLNETRFVERIQFFDGQRLFARDLQDVEQFAREMRELHNRSLHQPGIGNGFAIAAEAGDREVTVGPGYAIDIDGHEIILTRQHVESVPPVAGELDGSSVFYDLAVQYPSEDQLEETESRGGVCLSRDIVRRREQPIFCWIRLEVNHLGKLHPRDTKLSCLLDTCQLLVICRVEIKDCAIKSIQLPQRRDARPSNQLSTDSGNEDVGTARIMLAQQDVLVWSRNDETFIDSVEHVKRPDPYRLGLVRPLLSRIFFQDADYIILFPTLIQINARPGAFVGRPSYVFDIVPKNPDLSSLIYSSLAKQFLKITRESAQGFSLFFYLPYSPKRKTMLQNMTTAVQKTLFKDSLRKFQDDYGQNYSISWIGFE